MTNVERPIYSNFSSTNRNLCGDSIENMKVLSKIDGIKIIQDIKDQIDQDSLDPQFIKKNFKVLNHLKTACLEQCDSTLLDKEYPSIKDPEELRRLMSEVLIRFDTSPSNYMQDDYFALLKVVFRCLYPYPVWHKYSLYTFGQTKHPYAQPAVQPFEQC